ncbi:MAG: Ig-like domain-containing protein [Tannerella sp.]|nr:Ig-like domain-containing protein [Tannerella sp.]
MKAKFLLLLGTMMICLCLSGCSEDEKEATVTGILVTPGSIPAMEVGGTAVLTATITPAEATDGIRWVSQDPEIVSISGSGTTATLTALKLGTTKVFATNQSGTVTSSEVTVTVKSADYAGFVTGSYIGTAQVTGTLESEIPDVVVTLARSGNESAITTLKVVALFPDKGELTISGNQVNVAPGTEEGTYALSGTATVPLDGAEIPLNVSGTYRTSDKSLVLNLSSDNLITIRINALPGTAPTDYSPNVVGDYQGAAKVTGQLSADLSGVPVSLTRFGANKVTLSITADVPDIGTLTMTGNNITVAAGTAANTYTLAGTATMPVELLGASLTLNVSGTYDAAAQVLTLTLAESNGLVNIVVSARPKGYEPGDYAALAAGSYLGSAKLTGLQELDLSDVPVTLARVDNGSVTLNMKADIPDMGEVVISSDRVTVAESVTAHIYLLGGTATLTGLGIELEVSGTFNASTHTLALKLVAKGVNLTVEVEATPAPEPEPEPAPEEPSASLAETLAGDYLGAAQVTGLISEEVSSVPVKLSLIEGETDKVGFEIQATVPPLGLLTITAGEVSIAPGETENLYTLSGEASLAQPMPLTFALTGTFDASDGTLTLTLDSPGAVTINYTGSR